MTARFLTNGGFPDGWTVQNLSWLAQEHRRFALPRFSTHAVVERAAWHQRWAFIIEDVLETRRGEGH